MKSQFGGNVALTTNSTETSSAPGTKFVAGKGDGRKSVITERSGEGRKSVITERSGALPAHGQGASAARLGHHKRPPLPLGEDAIESLVKCKIEVKHSFGYKTYAQGSMQAYSSISLSAEKDSDKTDRVAFRVGNQVVLHDPHSGSQKFLSGQSRDVKHINFSSVSSNGKYICICESLRFDSTDDEVDATVSVYSMSTYTKIKTLTHSSSSDFNFAEFSRGEAKYLIGFIGEPDYIAAIFLWEKDKLVKSIDLTSNINRIRLATSVLPNSQPMFSASGNGYLKFWYSAADGNYKTANLLAHGKESEATIIDQHWMPHIPLAHHKLVVLANVDPSASSTKNDSGIPPPPQHLNLSLRQIVYIFEGADSQNGTPQLALELRQSIYLKPVIHNQMIKSLYSNIATYSKGFLLCGSSGSAVIYERSEEKRDPYLEIKKLLADDIDFISACVLHSEDKFLAMTNAGRILTIPLDNSTKPSLKAEETDNDAGMSNAGFSSLKSGGGPDSGSDSSFMSEELNAITAGYTDTVANRKLQNDSSGNILNLDKYLQTIGASDMLIGGIHKEAIISADCSFDRPIFGTISTDRFLKIWNYQTMKCEISHSFKSDEPLSIAMHCSGFQVLVSFKDRVRLYNFLIDKIVVAKETIQKSCKELKFSNGCQYWAGASALNIAVYDTKTFQLLCTFQGHMQVVKRLIWAPGDQILFSAGVDGNVYGWSVSTSDLRIDVITANNRSALITSLEVDCPSTAFPVSKVLTNDDGVDVASEIELNKHCVVAYVDTNVKIAPWSSDNKGGDSTRASTAQSSSVQNSLSSGDSSYTVHGDTRVFITSLCFSANRKHLIAGTSTGNIRIYPWPHNEQMTIPPPMISTLTNGGYPNGLYFGDVYVEVHAHSSSVISIKAAPSGDTILSAGEDGSIFVYSLTHIAPSKDLKKEKEKEKEGGEAKTREGDKPLFDFDFDDKEGFKFNNQVLMLSAEEMEDHVQEVALLRKLLVAIKTKADFLYNQKEAESADELKRILDHQEKKIIDERKRYDALKFDFDLHEKDLNSQMKEKELVYIKMTTELENKYEHKLAEQLDRFDKLNEDMELLKQRCELLITSERDDFIKQLNDLRSDARAREKKLRSENRRIMDERVVDEDSFKVILNQQEDEYEEELKQLIGAAESELSNERESVMKLRTLVQTKNTKLDQLKKKLIEVNNMAKSRLTLLNQERQEKTQLSQTIEHYKKNLAERETALAEKERVILELRSTTRTLENFRFVLDHRLQQLSVERGPITSHIEGLEKHIATMYEELVEEFEQKKIVAETLQLRDSKVVMQSKEIAKIRYEIRLKERYISSFKRDVENIVTAMSSGKELEESVNAIYRKYIRNEQIGSVAKANPDVAHAVEDLMAKDPAELALRNKSSNFIEEDVSADGNKQGKSGLGGGGGGYNGRSLVQEVEESLVDSAKESDRQRLFKEREVKNLHHRLGLAKEENERKSRRAIFDNSNLLYETNEMRKQIRDLERQLNDSRELVLVANKDLASLRQSIRKYKQGDFSTFDMMSLQNSEGGGKNGQLKDINERGSQDGSETSSHHDSQLDDTILKKFNDTTKKSVVMMLTGGPKAPIKDDDTLLTDSPVKGKEEDKNIQNIQNIQSSSNSSPSKPGSPLLQMDDGINQYILKDALGHSHSDGRLLHRNNSKGKQFDFGSEGFPIVKPISTPNNEFSSKHVGVNRALPREKASQKDKVIDSLNKKIEGLSELLDESQREKDMQRIEITRIRKQLHQLNQELNFSPIKSLNATGSPTIKGSNRLVLPDSFSIQSPDSFSDMDSKASSQQEDLKMRSLAPLVKRQ